MVHARGALSWLLLASCAGHVPSAVENKGGTPSIRITIDPREPTTENGLSQECTMGGRPSEDNLQALSHFFEQWCTQQGLHVVGVHAFREAAARPLSVKDLEVPETRGDLDAVVGIRAKTMGSEVVIVSNRSTMKFCFTASSKSGARELTGQEIWEIVP